MSDVKLFMLLLGAKPQGRHTEQHDIFFGIGTSLKELVPSINAFWPEAKKNLHIDAWREVNFIGLYKIQVVLKNENSVNDHSLKLFFINLGGYKRNEFEEYHQKLLVVAKDLPEAIAKAKQEIFYKETGFKGASSHIDDKYGIDVDEVYDVEEILPKEFSSKFSLQLTEALETLEDTIHLGYLPLWKIT